MDTTAYNMEYTTTSINNKIKHATTTRKYNKIFLTHSLSHTLALSQNFPLTLSHTHSLFLSKLPIEG
jgi:hypothetical protein